MSTGDKNIIPTVSIDNEQDRVSEQIAKVMQGKCSHQNICPVKDILARFGDKWSIHAILLMGQYNSRRFNQLKIGIPKISQRMLTVTLRTLEEDGIILRTHFPQIPPKVEYQLTDLGKSLLRKLLPLASWADDNYEEILTSRKKYKERSPLSQSNTNQSHLDF